MPEDKPSKAKPAKSKAKTAAKPAKKAAAKPAKTTKKAAKPAPKRTPLAARTFFPKKGSKKPEWRVYDAENQTLGRLSTRIASALMGKDKPTFTPHEDMGDFVVVVNAEKIKLTGKKLTDKIYKYYTGYPGGVKSFNPKRMLEKHPERILEWSVWGMLPKGHLGRKWIKKLKVYKGADHPHKAQNPKQISL